MESSRPEVLDDDMSHSERPTGSAGAGDDAVGKQPSETSRQPNAVERERAEGGDTAGEKSLRANPSEAGLFKDFLETLQQFLHEYTSRDTYTTERGQQFINSTVHYHYPATPRPSHPSEPGLKVTVDFAAMLATFIPPIGWEDALQRLQQHGVLIVAGLPGNGRRTLAYYLLYQLEAHAEKRMPFRQIGSANTLLDLDDEAFKQVETGCGYLLYLDTYTEAEKLSDKVLEQLVERTRQKSSYLIVVLPETPIVQFAAAWHFRLASHRLPASINVFRNHLEQLLRSQQQQLTTQQMEELINSADINAIVNESPNLKRVVHWAAFIADLCLMDSVSTAGIVAECRRLRAQWLRKDALDLITSSPSRAHLCLLMAASVMSDIHANLFKDLAESLQQVFDADFSPRDRKYWKQFWTGPRSRWLESAHAQATPMMEWVKGRRVRVDIIKIVPETLGVPLVDAFWDEYLQHREKLLDWLKHCGQHPNFRVRLAVARAIGILSLRDPIDIEQRVVMHWLLTEDVAVQESAAMSLAIACGQSPSTARAVLGQLSEWIEDDETRPRLIFASALIYAWLGIDAPGEFINGIHRLVNSRDVWVLRVDVRSATLSHTGLWRLSAVRFAFQRFLQLGNFKPDDYVALLGRILEWAQSNSTIQRRIARDVFIDTMLTDEALQVKTWEDREEEFIPAWPILLRIIERSQQTASLAARLFEYAAASKSTWTACLGGLKRMIIFAGNRSSARPFVKTLILSILTQGHRPEVGRLLRERLVHWAQSSDVGTAARPAPYSKNLVIWLRDRGLL